MLQKLLWSCQAWHGYIEVSNGRTDLGVVRVSVHVVSNVMRSYSICQRRIEWGRCSHNAWMTINGKTRRHRHERVVDGGVRMSNMSVDWHDEWPDYNVLPNMTTNSTHLSLSQYSHIQQSTACWPAGTRTEQVSRNVEQAQTQTATAIRRRRMRTPLDRRPDSLDRLRHVSALCDPVTFWPLMLICDGLTLCQVWWL